MSSADDGMMVNFVHGGGAPKREPAKKPKGTWKMKAKVMRSAKRAERHNRRKEQEAREKEKAAGGNGDTTGKAPGAAEASAAAGDATKPNTTSFPTTTTSSSSSTADAAAAVGDEPAKKPRVKRVVTKEDIARHRRYQLAMLDDAGPSTTIADLRTEVPFSDLGVLSPRTVAGLESMEITHPTEIQRLSLPALLSRRDAILRAETGSGKTLAYLVPIVESLVALSAARDAARPSDNNNNNNNNPANAEGGGESNTGGGNGGGGIARARLNRTSGTHAVILAPTRELAQQIAEVFERFTRRMPWLVCGCVVGGESRKKEKARLRKGVTVLVGTPGRLLDHLRSTQSLTLSLASLRWLIMDEADRLLDLGFEEDIRGILGLLPDADRHGVRRLNCLVSATIGKGVHRLQELSMEDPVIVDAGRAKGKNGATATQQRKQQQQEMQQQQVHNGNYDGNDDDTAARDGATAEGAEQGLAEEGAALVPASLRQQYVTVEPKERLAALVSYLRWKMLYTKKSKAIVFMASCDSVDFHHALFLSLYEEGKAPAAGAEAESTGAKSGYAGGNGNSNGNGSGAAGKRDAPKGPSDDMNWSDDDDDDEDDDEADDDGNDGDRPDGDDAAAAANDDNDNDDDDDDEAAAALRSDRTSHAIPVPIFRLHGNMPQASRNAAFRAFRRCAAGVLVCTDVAARGLDLPHVDWIVQYDQPGPVSDYLHRIGRTARLGREGHALLFLMPHESGYIHHLESSGVSGVRELELSLIFATLDPRRRDTTPSVVRMQQRIEGTVASPHLGLGKIAAEAYRASVRAYATSPAHLKSVFPLRELHLGHFAKAFGLRDAPSVLSKRLRGEIAKQKAADCAQGKGKGKGRGTGRGKGWSGHEHKGAFGGAPKRKADGEAGQQQQQQQGNKKRKKKLRI